MENRCDWAQAHPLLAEYHDREWGVPIYDDRLIFEFLVLDGAQAGLSWLTVLKKRDSYRQAFDNFDIQKVANYDESKIEELLRNPGIIRNKLKINSAVKNARAYIRVQEEFGSFSDYMWRFVDGKPIVNTHKTMKDIPPTSPESDKLSKDLKKRGFTFVGSTIIYAFMQAGGMVNDHIVSCFRYKELL
ncbi:MAG: DNA-3-methyladenine glycosylase I [Firmicutes bacterium]|nr:DNA-3-methyladenine glycosylase I [Bacillota bacterium]